MEKIYIVILLIIIYLVYRDFLKDSSIQNNENFENITLGNADDQNAINKLAQIANDLMKGGTTVPGNLNIEGNVDVKRGSQIKFARDQHQYLAWTADVDGPQLRGWTGGKLSMASPAKDSLIWNNDGVIVNGSSKITGNLTVGDGKHEWSNLIQVFSGQKQGGFIEFLNKDGGRNCYVMGNPNETVISNDLSIGGNLKVNGFTKGRLYVQKGIAWDSRKFLDDVATKFSGNDPDGTCIEVLTIGAVNNHIRRWTAVKYGNQIYSFGTRLWNDRWDYEWGGLDPNNNPFNTPGFNDGFRKRFI
jgi:hypothetical protein